MAIALRAGTEIRQLREEDVDAAEEVAWEAMSDVGRRFGFTLGTRDGARIGFARSRVRHLMTTDPDGSFVAEEDGKPVGIALALRRGSLWFLSLLAVRGDRQAMGIGRRLLDATLEYGRDSSTALICASPDPKALRRYGRAGFALHPGFEAVGVPDRTSLPADLGVRDGDWDADADFVDQLIAERRGEPYGPDLAWCRERGMRLLLRDGGTRADRAAVLVHGGRVGALAAASEEAAARVLWAAIAEAPAEVTLGYLLGNQQWAIDVALAARLPLSLTDTVCVRGRPDPPAPYLPFGILG
jgi:predicted N-acetyltransferase YhbS